MPLADGVKLDSAKSLVSDWEFLELSNLDGFSVSIARVARISWRYVKNIPYHTHFSLHRGD